MKTHENYRQKSTKQRINVPRRKICQKAKTLFHKEQYLYICTNFHRHKEGFFVIEVATIINCKKCV